MTRISQQECRGILENLSGQWLSGKYAVGPNYTQKEEYKYENTVF